MVIITVLIAGVAAAWLAALLQPRAPVAPPPSPATGLTTEDGRYLFSVTLHTPEEIAGLLTRAEELAKTRRPDSRHTGIALVLHGPEIEIFTKKNYARFRETVDLAARLNDGHVVEIKMCRTEMKRLGIGEEDIPAFIELVPYGPDEEKRLQRNGYVYL
ncbi:MAG TPA: DsrE family protein [Sulfuricaulis sp.]|nr:DsrE family protein [Sulfuricaulis sp.]